MFGFAIPTGKLPFFELEHYEEVLFRGLMTRKFLTKMDFWKANFLQAALFGA